MRRRESRRRSRHNRTSKSPAMWPGFLAAQIVREYSLLLIFLCKIFPEKLDKARGGRRGILDSPFQSTPPRGGRLLVVSVTVGVSLFQSTPPARGATERNVRDGADASNFNPRPPRGGRLLRCAYPCRSAYFNPRPPRGGRRQGSSRQAASAAFQSTPPARGATISCPGRAAGVLISIHAPREGGDRDFSG